MMEDHTCYLATTCILTTALAWCAIRLLSNSITPRHLTASHKQRQWKSNFMFMVFAAVMSILSSLALMVSSTESKEDNITTRFSCSSYYVICIALTYYVLDLMDLITHMKTSGQFMSVAHHLAAISLFSVGVFGKSQVCLIAATEICESTSVLHHLAKLLTLYGFQRKGRIYQSIAKLRNCAFFCVRSAFFLWAQWQLFQHGADMETTSFYMIEITSVCLFVHNMVIMNMLIHEKTD